MLRQSFWLLCTINLLFFPLLLKQETFPVTAQTKASAENMGINAKHNWQAEWQFETKKIPAYINYLQLTGVKYMRQSIHWNQLQPEENTPVEDWNWKKIDLLLTETVKADMEPVIVWVHPPRWATAAPEGEELSDYLVKPEKLPAYRSFVRELVGRYGNCDPQTSGYACKGWVKYWEPFSEMYLRAIRDTISPQQYLEVIKPSYQIVKEIDPTAVVLMGALNNTSDWFAEFLQLGGGDYFDKMNLHIYRSPERAAGIIGRVDTQMKENGVEKPIWITEVNLGPQNYLDRGKQDLCPQPDDTTRDLNYIRQYFEILLDAGAEKVFYLPSFCHFWGPGFLELCSEMPREYCKTRDICTSRNVCSDTLIVREKSFRAFRKAVGKNPCPPSDFYCDGDTNLSDLLHWRALFAAGEVGVDVNTDGQGSIFDYLWLLRGWLGS